MRTIKFRALVKSVWGTRWEYYRTFDQPSWLEGDNEILVKDLQYTGFSDKNEKEVYSGDIVRCDGKLGEVMYDEQQGAYIILWQPHNKKQKSGCDYLASTWLGVLKEIIGNIWENPELRR